jgi:hypothetical protein
LDEAAHVIREVLHPDLSLGAHRSNSAHPDAGLGVVAALGLIGQRFAPLALAMDVTFEHLRMLFSLDLIRTMGSIRPDPCAGVATHQQVIHGL